MVSSSLIHQVGLARIDDLRREANERRHAKEAEGTFNGRGHADASAPVHEVRRLRERDG
jgi:hypothetical protein